MSKKRKCGGRGARARRRARRALERLQKEQDNDNKGEEVDMTGSCCLDAAIEEIFLDAAINAATEYLCKHGVPVKLGMLDSVFAATNLQERIDIAVVRCEIATRDCKSHHTMREIVLDTLSRNGAEYGIKVAEWLRGQLEQQKGTDNG